MSQNPFEQFIMLVHVDQKINSLHAVIQSLQKENAATIEQDLENQRMLDAIKQKLHDAHKEVDAKELELKVIDQQETDKKGRLEGVANHKEYQSIKAEIDVLKNKQHGIESELLALWNRSESVKRELEAATKKYEQQAHELIQKREHNVQQVDLLHQELKVLMAQREEKEKHIPAEWLEKYALMRTRVADPVVPAVHEICTACFYKVSAQDLQLLKRRKLIQCKDCFRLLYLPEAQQQSDNT